MSVVLDPHGKLHGIVLSNAQPIAGVVIVYSTIMYVGGMGQVGFWGRLTGANPNVSVYAEYSPTQVAGDFGEVDGGSKVANLIDVLVHNKAVITKQSNYMRLRLVGNDGNGANIVADIVINTAK